MRDFLKRQLEPKQLATLSFADYRTLVSDIPPPSDDQIRDFVEFVSGAHSWYKHLPVLSPGQPFCFFVDPHSGMDRVIQDEGGVAYLPRTDESFQFHYTWMKTDDYRARFGCLEYSCDAGTSFVLPVAVQKQDIPTEDKGLLDSGTASATICISGEGECWLPREVIDVGTVSVTASIHELAPRPWVWFRMKLHKGPMTWPEATGGNDTLSKIRERCDFYRARYEKGDYAGIDEIDEVLAQLIAPERERLQKEMYHTIGRVITLLYGKIS
jgi:hypothetical protein